KRRHPGISSELRSREGGECASTRQHTAPSTTVKERPHALVRVHPEVFNNINLTSNAWAIRWAAPATPRPFVLAPSLLTLYALSAFCHCRKCILRSGLQWRPVLACCRRVVASTRDARPLDCWQRGA